MPSDNHRSSRTLLSYDDALARLLAHAPQLQASEVGLGDATGRVLRDPVLADRDQPPFNRSAMDGFAMNAAAINAAMQADPSGAFPIIGDVPAGAAPPTIHTNTDAPPGVVRIATGAMLPDGYDAVVQIELSEVAESSNGPASVRFALDTITPWQNVHHRAADASRGDTLIAAGARLSPHHLGIAASAGAVMLVVSDRPRVVVLSTGDEVLPPDTATDALLPHQIRNSNGPILVALLAAMGAEVVEHRHLPDEAEHVRAAAREALGRAHLVITAGGVSVGQRDLLPWAWQQLGCHTLIHGVAIQPGKPAVRRITHRPLAARDARRGQQQARHRLAGQPRQRAGHGAPFRLAVAAPHARGGGGGAGIALASRALGRADQASAGQTVVSRRTDSRGRPSRDHPLARLGRPRAHQPWRGLGATADAGAGASRRQRGGLSASGEWMNQHVPGGVASEMETPTPQPTLKSTEPEETKQASETERAPQAGPMRGNTARWHRRLAHSLVIWCVAGTLVGFLGAWWWVLDLFAHFRVQYAVLLLAAIVMMALSRPRPKAMLAIALIAVLANVLVINELSSEPSRTRNMHGGPLLSLVHFNVHSSNTDYDRVLGYLASTHADVIVLQEITSGWQSPIKTSLPGYREVAMVPRRDNFGIAVYLRSHAPPRPADHETATPFSAPTKLTLLSSRTYDITEGEAMVPAVALRLGVEGADGFSEEVAILAIHTLPPTGADYARIRGLQMSAAAQWASRRAAWR